MATDYNIKINAEDNTKGAFSSINSGLGGLSLSAGKVKAAFAAAAAAFAVGAVIGKVTETIDSMDNLAKSARAAGATASNEAFQGFQVMKQAMNEAGIDAGTFDRAMLQTTNRLQKGIEGQKSFAAITDKLGSSIKTANGEIKAGPELLTEMINALNKGTITTDEFSKVVGGRAGPLIQSQFGSINDTAEKLEATLSDVAENSNIVSLDAANNAEVFNDNIGRLKEGMGQLLTDAITPLLPHLVKLSEEIMAKMPAIVEKVQSAFETLQPVFSLIGTVLTDIVFPIMQKVFEVLGFIAEAITPLVDSAIPGLKSAFEGIKGIVEEIVGFFSGVAESLTNIKNKAVELKDSVGGVFTDMAEQAKSKAKDMKDGVLNMFGLLKKDAVDQSIIPDMVKAIIDWFKIQDTEVTRITSKTVDGVLGSYNRMETGVTASTQRMATQSGEFSKTIEDDFASTLENALSDGKLSLSDFEGFFRSSMTKLITHALSGSNGIGGAFGSLFGGGAGGGLFGGLGSMFSGIFGGGGGGGLFSSIGSLFGGFFSQGGYLSAGKVGIVGEAGPELIRGPANITPMDEAGGGVTNINFNINAIDTQTGTQFLIDNKKNIEGIIQNAYTKRGRQGIY